MNNSLDLRNSYKIKLTHICGGEKVYIVTSRDPVIALDEAIKEFKKKIKMKHSGDLEFMSFISMEIIPSFGTVLCEDAT